MSRAISAAATRSATWTTGRYCRRFRRRRWSSPAAAIRRPRSRPANTSSSTFQAPRSPCSKPRIFRTWSSRRRTPTRCWGFCARGPAKLAGKAMTSPDRDGKIFVGKGDHDQYLAQALANRHGLATGATGTGKTVSLQVLAEGFSRAGVSVFAADIKGDLSGIAARGEANPNFVKRAKDLGFDYQPEEFPVVFWDLFGEQGHPIRANVFEMGPLLVARMLELNDVQEGIINIAFRFADDDPELGA